MLGTAALANYLMIFKEEDIEIIWVNSHAQPFESWLAIHRGEVIGHTYMLIEPGEKIKFADSWVHPDWRGNGIFRKLWEARWSSVGARYKGYLAYAWCKDNSLPLLLEKGFVPGEKCTYVELKVAVENSEE
jgi:hypothetical protein